MKTNESVVNSGKTLNAMKGTNEVRTYKVYGHVTVSCWTEVEANSSDEAYAIAKRRELAEHHIDGSYEVEECWHFDNDGTPERVVVGEEMK